MMWVVCYRRFRHTFYVRSRQSIEQLHKARLVRITNGRLAIWLHPFGMLEPQVVVNLPPKLSVGMDLTKHGYCFVKDSGVPGEGFLQRLGGMVGQRRRCYIASFVRQSVS